MNYRILSGPFANKIGYLESEKLPYSVGLDGLLNTKHILVLRVDNTLARISANNAELVN